MQLTASQRWLQHITSVHSAFSLASPYHGMQLIDKQDDGSFLLGEFVKHCLQALFEFTPKLCSRNQGPHIKRKYLFVLQTLGNFAIHDSLCQSFNNCRFTHSRLSNQHGVILGAALQYLYGATNL